VPLPTTDQLFGTAASTSAAATGLPTTAQLFPDSASSPGGDPPQTGAAFDAAWSARDLPITNVLNAFGGGAAQGWGSEPMDMTADFQADLRKAGIWNDYKDGHDSFIKSVNEALWRPALSTVGSVAGALFRAPGAVAGGAGAALSTAGQEIEGQTPNVAQKAVGGVLRGASELSYAAGEGYIGPEFGFGIASERAIHAAGETEMVSQANRARAVGAIGEGEAGYYDAAPITPENAQARAEAAQDAGVEPVAPEPPPPDIHVLARRIDPDTFEQYDALALEREQHRATIAGLGEERANSPEAVAAQDQIDTIMGKVNGVEARLTNAARGRLDDARGALENALRDDTPEMRQARAALLDADFAMRDLAPDVSSAYRQAREMAPDIPETAAVAAEEGERPEEAAAKAEKTTAEAATETGAPQTTPDQEAGIRAAPAAAVEAAKEGQPPNVVGEAAKVESSQNVPTAAETAETPTTAERATPLPEATGPSPGLKQAAEDVAEHRSKRPPKSNILQAIKKLGGMRVTEADGSLTAGPDVQGALEGFKNKPVGVINNETGLSPERMHEALTEQGWFGHGDIHREALVRAIEKQARGEDVYHPDSGLAEQHARRAALDEEMTKAGVKRGDDATTAAMKLSHWREVQQRTAERMDTLRARADELGIGHGVETTYDGLLSDILEREAIEGDATEHGYDTYEDDIDAGLTDDDVAWLNRYFAEQHGERGGAFGLSETREPSGGAQAATGEPAKGATGGGEGAATVGGRGVSGSGDFGVAETGRARTRGVSATTETRALENGLTQSLGDLPEYNQMSKADQAARVVAEMDRDWENSVSIAMGDRAPPHGVLPESFYEGVRMRAIAEGDFDTVRRLATESKLISEATTMGRRIGMYAARDPTDPVSAIKDVVKAREAAVGGDLTAAKARETSAIRDEIVNATPSHDQFRDFLDTLEC
jgi:hypothetical protein